jgi:hypothetical protein
MIWTVSDKEGGRLSHVFHRKDRSNREHLKEVSHHDSYARDLQSISMYGLAKDCHGKAKGSL